MNELAKAWRAALESRADAVITVDNYIPSVSDDGTWGGSLGTSTERGWGAIHDDYTKWVEFLDNMISNDISVLDGPDAPEQEARLQRLVVEIDTAHQKVVTKAATEARAHAIIQQLLKAAKDADDARADLAAVGRRIDQILSTPSPSTDRVVLPLPVPPPGAHGPTVPVPTLDDLPDPFTSGLSPQARDRAAIAALQGGGPGPGHGDEFFFGLGGASSRSFELPAAPAAASEWARSRPSPAVRGT